MPEIHVRVHPRSSKKELVLKEGLYHAYIHSPPEKGKANKETAELLASLFNVPKTQIHLKQGEKSRNKVFEF